MSEPKAVGMGTIGERLKDDPTPAASMDEAARFMDLLPPPPRPLGDQSDDDIERWLHSVADAGGIPALTWVHDPSNWPYGPVARGRMQHIIGAMKRHLDDTAKRERELQAHRLREELREKDREARKAKGWA